MKDTKDLKVIKENKLFITWRDDEKGKFYTQRKRLPSKITSFGKEISRLTKEGYSIPAIKHIKNTFSTDIPTAVILYNLFSNYPNKLKYTQKHVDIANFIFGIDI